MSACWPAGGRPAATGFQERPRLSPGPLALGVLLEADTDVRAAKGLGDQEVAEWLFFRNICYSTFNWSLENVMANF